ncbi:hypothetical protein BED47_00705 [Gottfriedia luciferensis]|uniref:HNH nuclease domain-containing protein n=1 Tax=Gottfriedia luciferensis TaxID=178774 RepID=A0ABX3A352_9BACI|nr:HNH endonuclease [Gottfriedia luciferensis]ODG93723.1 hypothetical protein BED47_00705 [Gottfriedia luciferensis]
MKKNVREDVITIDGKVLYGVPGCPGFYADVEEGKVFNTFSEKWMGLNSEGSKRTSYVYITIRDKYGSPYPISEHWAVLSAYYGICKDELIEKGLTCHHENGIKNDNRIDNLRLVRFKDQFKDKRTKDKIKSRNGKRLTKLQKESLIEAWNSLEEPKRSEFVNEYYPKMEVSWRAIDGFVVNHLLNKDEEGDLNETAV